MKRDSFVFRREFYNPTKDLSNEEKAKLFDAICNYGFDGKFPDDLPPMVEMAFKFIEPVIKRDAEKYERRVRANRQNINKRWGNDTKNTSGINGIDSYSDNDSDNDNDNGSDNHNELPLQKESNDVKYLGFNISKAGTQFLPSVKKWLSYKKSIKDPYRVQDSVNVMIDELKSLGNYNPELCMKVVNQSIGKNWKGLYELKKSNHGTIQKYSTKAEQTKFAAINTIANIAERVKADQQNGGEFTG